MSNERQHRAEIIRLIVTTRERFPHTPAITEAMRRVIWRYARSAERNNESAKKRKSNKAKKRVGDKAKK